MLPHVQAQAIYTSNAAFALGGVPYVPIVGPADDGPLDTPTVITQPSQAVATFGGGPLARWAAKVIRSKKLPVLAVRAAATAASAFSAVGRSTGHGASVVSVHSGSATAINAVVKVLVVVGGTVGGASPAITYQVSIDGGASYGEVTGLSTETSIDIDLGGETLTLDLTTASLVAGEVITVTASYINQGTYGTLNTSLYPGGANTASASVDATSYPNDDYEVLIRFVQGGTLGTAGITYQVSLTNGRRPGDWSQVLALGTALYIVVPGTGQPGVSGSGAKIVLGTGGQTVGTGASLYVRTYAPAVNVGSASSATDALFLNKQNWERVLYASAITDATTATTIDAIFAANYSLTIHGEKSWIANYRIQNDGETTAAYKTAGKAFSALARSLYFGSICFGDCKMVDAITGYTHKRPVALAVGMELASIALDVDIAWTGRPGLAVQLSTDDGNPDCYDDGLYAGEMDDYGFITLRGDQPEGVYVTNPRMFVPAGTNIPMTYHRDLLNIHTRVARDVGRKALSKGLRADKTTGHIEEAAAALLETVMNDVENDTLAPYISNQLISVSRTDNLNADPPTLNISGQLQTKLYPKVIVYTDQIVAAIAG